MVIPPRPSADIYIPTETEFADDVTFISTSAEYLHEALPIVKTRLLEWYLNVNDNKTEWVDLVLSDQAEDKYLYHDGWLHLFLIPFLFTYNYIC